MAKHKLRSVSFNDVSLISMTCGNEKRLNKVIHNGMVKQWVGIGWIELEKATEEDYLKFPEVRS